MSGQWSRNVCCNNNIMLGTTFLFHEWAEVSVFKKYGCHIPTIVLSMNEGGSYKDNLL